MTFCTLETVNEAARQAAIRAQTLHRSGRLAEARTAYREVVALAPAWLEARVNLGLVALALRDATEAVAALRSVVAERADLTAAWEALSRAHAMLGEADAAIEASGRLVALVPNDPRYWLRHAENLRGQQRNTEAREALSTLVALDPDFLPARWARWNTLAVPSRDEADVERQWREWQEDLGFFESLRDDDPRVAHFARDCLLDSTNFYLHCLGRDATDLQRRYARVVERFAHRALPPSALPPRKAGKRRIGFISPNFAYGTVGKVFRAWPLGLDRSRFELHAFDLGEVADDWTADVRGVADRYVAGARNAAGWIAAIRESALDALVFIDVGMSPLVQWLAAYRHAPFQAACWGHPVTTGAPTIDVFFGGEAMEPPGSEREYSERLVRLPNLAICYEPPTLEPDRDFAESVWGEASVRYFCPQAAFKLLPAHDALFARILAADPRAKLVLLPSRNPTVCAQLVERMRPAFAAHGASIDQLDCRAFQPEPRFLGLAATADLLLDSLEWSGGNTTLEALWFGALPVALPGRTLRGRQTLAMLTRLGVADELVVSDTDAYVDRAIALGGDRSQRDAIRARLLANRDRLFRDRAPIDAMNAFFDALPPRG